jgi:hypothetical protein
MASKIKVDNINKVSDDSNIIKKCGTTTTIGSGASNPIVVDGSAVTIGRCGGTVSLASGATQTGFGRTGTVDWQTGDVKTATFTAVSGKGYFCNTTGGTFELDLPSGTAGDIVSVQDYNNTFDDNNLTIDPNGSQKINGGVAGGTIILNTEGEGLTLVYVDSTVGWRTVHSDDFADVPTNYLVATGGTIVTCGDYKTHIFTGPGTFTVTSGGAPCGSNSVEHLTVAGGGGGGGGSGSAGGGAGGYRQNYPSPTTGGIPVIAQAYPITVGAAGAADSSSPYHPPGCSSGSNSIFSSITSAGGGGGGSESSSASITVGANGGSGGGGAFGPSPSKCGGSGNTPPVSPPQGNNGGQSDRTGPTYLAGGGGGAGAVGGSPATCGSTTGPGGAGTASSITGSPVLRAGGGGAGKSPPSYGSRNAGTAGPGGGGAGQPGPGTDPSAIGTVNTGGGGGGAFGGPNPSPSCGGTGGSGIVIIRYKYQN